MSKTIIYQGVALYKIHHTFKNEFFKIIISGGSTKSNTIEMIKGWSGSEQVVNRFSNSLSSEK